jgi:hypothetical protein
MLGPIFMLIYLLSVLWIMTDIFEGFVECQVLLGFIILCWCGIPVIIMFEHFKRKLSE